MTFANFNRSWISTLIGRKDEILKDGTIEKVQDYIEDQGAHLVEMLPIPLIFDQGDYEKLAEAGRLLLSAQKKIIRHLCGTMSKEGVLRMFQAPESLVPFIDWDELVNGRHVIARFDVVPSNQGYSFCEINSDSSIFGSEVFDCFKIYSEASALPFADEDHSPLAKIAEFLKAVVEEKGLERIVICDLKKYKDMGYFSFDTMRRYLDKAMPGIPVHVVDETNYPEELLDPRMGKKTLVYRVFVFSDMDGHAGFFEQVCRSEATIINTFESEIRMNRRWFALVHDERYAGLLDAREIAAIREYVPPTFMLSEDNVERAIAERKDLVFKRSYTYGGIGVVMGEASSSDDLRRVLNEKGVDKWAAQELVRYEGMDIPLDVEFKPVSNQLVFGIYLVNDESAGVLVRASNVSKVVNVSSGKAKIAWATPMSRDARDRILTGMGA